MMNQIPWGRLPDRLNVAGFAKDAPDNEIEEYCKRFGHFIQFFRTAAKTHVFLTYISSEEADQAYQKLKKANLNVQYAFDKKGVYTKPRYQPPSPPKVRRAIFSSGCRIILVNVLDDFHFYVLKDSVEREYKEFIKSVTCLGKNAESVKELPKRASFVLAPRNGDYCRALVLRDVHSTRDEVSLKYVDYGVSAKIPFRHLRIAPEDIDNVKFLCRYVLDGVDSNSSFALDFFKSFIGSTLEMKTECGEPTTDASITLIDLESKLNINSLIKQIAQPCRIEKYHFETVPIENDTEKYLFVVDNSKLRSGYNLITFVDERNSLIFTKQRNQIQTICKLLERFPPHSPIQDEIIVVKHDGYWYRGIFDGNKDGANNVKVALVDIWKIVHIKLENIRKIPEIIAEMPVLSFNAEIDGLGLKIDRENVNNLVLKFPMYENVQVKSIYKKPGQDDDDYIIQI